MEEEKRNFWLPCCLCYIEFNKTDFNPNDKIIFQCNGFNKEHLQKEYNLTWESGYSEALYFPPICN